MQETSTSGVQLAGFHVSVTNWILGSNMKIRVSLLLLLLSLWVNTAFAGSGDRADEGPWWVGHLITAMAAIIGALMIVWQIGRQRRNEIEMQTDNFRTQLRLQIFQEFSVQLTATSDALIEAGNCALTLHMKSEGQPPMDPFPRLIELNGKAGLELGRVVCLLTRQLNSKELFA